MIGRLLDRIGRALDPLDVAARLVLLVLLLLPELMGDAWYQQVLLRGLAVLGLVVPGAHRRWWLWLGLLAVLGEKTLENWWTQDNHRFLLTWFALAMTLGLVSRDPGDVVGRATRWLLGASFGFAVLWKGILSPDFVRGDYFHFVMLADARFHDAAALVAGLGDLEIAQNLARHAELGSGADAVVLVDTPRLRLLSGAVTAWTLLIEGALAVTFLAPRGSRLFALRHVPLLVFGATTYLVATVLSFGWILMTLGVAQCEPEATRTRALYLGVCLLLLLYAFVPLLPTLRGVFGV